MFFFLQLVTTISMKAYPEVLQSSIYVDHLILHFFK